MKSYLLLIKGSFAKWNQLPESKRNEVFSQFSNFAAELGKHGYLKGGEGCNERSFRLMNPNAKETDCLIPPDSNDMVTGYFLIEVPDENEALKMARQCPAFNCGEYVELVPCSGS